MTVSEHNIRRLITFPKDLKKDLDELAVQENRSFNNMVITILLRHMEEESKKRESPTKK